MDCIVIPQISCSQKDKENSLELSRFQSDDAQRIGTQETSPIEFQPTKPKRKEVKSSEEGKQGLVLLD